MVTTTKKFRHLILGLCFSVSAMTTTVWADSIDGRWCFTDGSQLVIEGVYVITPGGSKIEGAYDRHHFTFKMPKDEPNAGFEVDIVLTTNSQISVRYLARSNNEKYLLPEFWMRCDQPSS